MKVSVLCANYNNAPYLDDFFHSLENSSFCPEEIIFVDDASKDNSLDIAKKYSARLNIKILALQQNVGFANALNKGLLHCSSDYIARIDPDDVAAPQRFERQVSFLDKNPQFGAVGSQAEYFLSETGQRLNRTNMPTNETAISKAYYRGDNGLLHGTITIRREIFQRHKYSQQEVPSEDYGIFLRILKTGVRYANLNEPLTFVRVHSKSVSNDIRLDTIRKLFDIRKNILTQNYSKFDLYRNFFALKYYRKYLFEKNRLTKFIYIMLACTFGLDRVWRRITSKP